MSNRPGRPFLSYLQFVREATWGTQIAATKRLPVVSIDLAPDSGLIESQSLNNSIAVPTYFGGGKRTKVGLEFEFQWDGFQILVDACMGTATFGSSGASNSGVGPYLHAWDQQDILNSLSLEIGTGDIAATKVQKVPGFKVASFGWSGKGGFNDSANVVHFKMDGWGKPPTFDQSPTGALTAPTFSPILWSQTDSSTTDNVTTTANFKIRSFDVNCVNQLADDRFNGNLAGQFDEPVRKDFAKVTAKFVCEFQTSEAWTQFMAQSLMGTGPTVHFTGSGASAGYSCALSLNKAFLIGPVSTPIKRGDLIMQDVTYGAVADSSGSGLHVSFSNGTATE